jgi:hypothetical protein
MASLVREGFEHKFLVPEAQAEPLLAALESLLAPDPHAGADGQYGVLSLYLDTPDLAAYRRETNGKWRLRRYGDGPTVFAEFKEKPEPGRVIKRRTPIAPETLPTLGKGDSSVAWFEAAMRDGQLAPQRLVGYVRHAFVGALGDVPVRVTLDRSIQGARAQALHLPARIDSGVPLVDGRLLEIKCARDLPDPLSALARTLALSPSTVSKYRLSVERA